jgi:transcriptional regulator with XRE-family HTH domain
MPVSVARTAKRDERGSRRAQDIDRHIGARLRERRIALGLTQQQLAELLLGIAYQQLHKYEKGTNRIAAGRLYTIAQALGVGAGYFFEGLEQPPPIATPKQRQMLELARDFARLSRPHQEALHALARALAGTPEGEQPEPEEGARAAA